jgi:hypothetical protein
MIGLFLILPILFTTPSNVPSTTFTLNDTNILNVGLSSEYNSTTTVEQSNSTTESVSNNIAVCESLYTTYIPQNIRTYLEQHGWTYQLVTRETLAGLAGTNNIIGYTDVKNKIVYVEENTRNGGCYIRIGTNQDGSFTGYYVKESYSFLKRELL